MSIFVNQLVSVIIPAYNVEKYVERCVYSVINQTYHDIEIVIVDDGSTDSTGMLCDKLAKEDDRIMVVHKMNGGLSDAKNVGISESHGEYIVFVDSDDYVATDMIEQMMCAMTEPYISMVVVGFWQQKGENKTYCGPAGNRMISGEEALMDIFVGHEVYSASWNKLYRRELFENNRFVVGMINEDSEIVTKLLVECNMVVLIAKPLYFYMIREGSITQSVFSKKNYEGIKAYRTAVNICKDRKKEMLPFARYYEASRIYNTYIELVKSDAMMINYRFLLRVILFVRSLVCLFSARLREKYLIEMLIYFFTSIFGYDTTQKILNARRKRFVD